MKYLLEYYFFSPEDITLNNDVMNWSKRITPVFEHNENVSYFLYTILYSFTLFYTIFTLF